MSTDTIIIGGGLVGLSLAYGLTRRGHRVAVFDEGDGAFRASRGNFGLVWVQGKGVGRPAYAHWTRSSAAAWKEFADEIGSAAGTDVALQQNGGYRFCMTEEELEQVTRDYEALRQDLDGDYPFEALGHNALKREEPHIGPKVAGALFHQEDGQVNPLILLRSLAVATRNDGVTVTTGAHVETIEARAGGFEITLADGRREAAARIALCAGIGGARLGPMLGFKVPIRPQRGQVLITERLPKILNRPSDTIRQVGEGGIQIGASAEEAGFDDRESLEVTAQLARSAIDVLPVLETTSLVRSWGALRVMSRDGFPIYQESPSHPGAFLVTCHSGVTLAAAHARFLPLWLDGDAAAPDLSAFSEDRFDDEAA